MSSHKYFMHIYDKNSFKVTTNYMWEAGTVKFDNTFEI